MEHSEAAKTRTRGDHRSIFERLSRRSLDDITPDVRVINLETRVTQSEAFAPAKALHYRMHPHNLPYLATGRPDACVLANNPTNCICIIFAHSYASNPSKIKRGAKCSRLQRRM